MSVHYLQRNVLYQVGKLTGITNDEAFRETFASNALNDCACAHAHICE